METTTLSIPSITCGHCARTITKAVEPLAGIQSVSVDVPGRSVTLGYDQSSDLDAALAVLASMGYPAAESPSCGLSVAAPPVETAIDPICGMTVAVAGAAFSAVSEGTAYYFCSAGCEEEFLANEHPSEAEPVPQLAEASCACCAA